MIQVERLTRSFGEVKAVDDLSFAVAEGETFGLLGPNGAGKSTTIHMLAGVLAPDRGRIRIAGGQDPTRPAVRAQIGIAPQKLALYEELTGIENLRFFGRLYGLGGADLEARVEAGLELAGLWDKRGRRVRTYSGGMQRRLNLACAVLHRPRVLFLDEPTAGVDPQSRTHILSSIDELGRDGCTVLYTTHYIEEAARLCDRVAILDHGRILALDRVAGLIAAHGGAAKVTAELTGPPPEGAVAPGPVDGERVTFTSDRPLEKLLELAAAGWSLGTFRVDRADLETVFLALTGRKLRDG